MMSTELDMDELFWKHRVGPNADKRKAHLRIAALEQALLEAMESNWLDDDAPERFDLYNLPAASIMRSAE